MTLRENSETLIHRIFGGIREVGDHIEDRIDEIHGVMDRPITDLRRLEGKLLNSTTTTSTVWSLHQLRFRDRVVTIDHTGSNLFSYPESPIQPGVLYDEISLPEPNEIQGGAGDVWWPEEYPQTSDVQGVVEDAQNDIQGKLPSFLEDARTIPYNLVLAFTPDPSEIDMDEGETSTSGTLAITQNAVRVVGFWGLRYTWTGDYTWLAVRSGQLTLSSGEIFSTLWTDGGLLAKEDDIDMVIIDENAVPGGTTVVNMTVQLVVTSLSSFSVVKNADGTDLVETFILNVINFGDPLMTVGGDTLTWVVGSDDSSTAKTVTVTNDGDPASVLPWTAALAVDAAISGAVSIDVSSGDTNQGVTDNIVVTFNPSGVAEGVYAGTLTITDTENNVEEVLIISITVWDLANFPGGVHLFTFNWPNGKAKNVGKITPTPAGHSIVYGSAASDGHGVRLTGGSWLAQYLIPASGGGDGGLTGWIGISPAIDLPDTFEGHTHQVWGEYRAEHDDYIGFDLP